MGEAAFIFQTEEQRDRAWLVNYLKDEMSWRTAKDIRHATGLTPLRVRQLAQHYPTLLVSSALGYKLARNATRSEVMQCVQSLLHRSQKIMERASALTGMIR